MIVDLRLCARYRGFSRNLSGVMIGPRTGIGICFGRGSHLLPCRIYIHCGGIWALASMTLRCSNAVLSEVLSSSQSIIGKSKI